MPKGTEVQKQLPKKLIFEKFNLNTAAQEKFNANIARIYIVNEISPATTNIAEGETVNAVYVLQILLKKRDYDPKEILLIARLIEQRMIFVLTFEEQISVAVVRGRLLASDCMLVKRPLLVGDDFVLTGFKETEWKEKLLQNGE